MKAPALTPDDLLTKLKEIEDLICDKKDPDGPWDYDIERIMVSLEIARRMLI